MDTFWENPGWETQDRHLSSLRDAPFQRPFPELPLKKGLTLIRGPRQVGKSSWLKTILAMWPEPSTAFYLSCENISNHKELAAILESLRSTRRLVLLDEISFVDEWTKAVKHELDSNPQMILIVTGSHAADLRKGGDQMPGRFSVNGEKFLLPMSFSEFTAMRSKAGWKKLSHLENLRLFFRIGGFPTAVAEAGEDGKIPHQSMAIYRRWLTGDILKQGKQEIYLREILAQIAITLSTPISLQKLAQKTQIGSHHTAQGYASVLEDSFALRTLYAIDPNTGAYRFRKEKKFYFTDPLIFWLALEWAGHPVPQEAESLMAEQVAHEELVRHFHGQSVRMGYLASPRGEIDFYARKVFSLEVKWSDFTRNLSKAFQDTPSPQRMVWNRENFLKNWPKAKA